MASRSKRSAQATKQSILYVLNRVTGEPVWPFVERPVPQGDVPGEWYSPTQPIPTKPPFYDWNGSTIDDLIDFTPELRAQAIKLVSRYKLGPVFTPPVVSKVDGPLGTLIVGYPNGGTNWAGGSFDPQTHIYYVFSERVAGSLGLVPRESGDSDVKYFVGTVHESGRAFHRLTVQGLPLVKPPYGRISAINLDTGEIVWQVAHGETPDEIRNSPVLKGLNIPRTGRPGIHWCIDHQDARDCRRRRHLHQRGRAAGSTVTCIRQGHRQGRRRRVHAIRTNRFAHDLHAQRQAIHSASHRRPRLSRRVISLQPG